MEDFKVPTLPPPTSKIEKTEKQPEIKKDTDVEKESQPVTNSCPYKEPTWSASPNNFTVNYKFEVLKSGQIIEEVENLQKQSNWKFGRLPENDIVLAHPTISRFHSVLQYRPKIEKASADDAESPAEGWYIYDLDSTHGTFLNKQRIPPRVFIRIRVGHMLRMGASTRSYILQGPMDDEEPESELSVTELREQRRQQQEAAAETKRKSLEAAEENLRNEGISWGMAEDADEEPDLTDNPYASTNNEELFLDDPKRTLRGYFEREDLPLEYKCDEMSAGCFVCRVELPIDDANGRPIVAEVIHKGRKKECVVQCALEACRILDRYGVLRQANQEPVRRKLQKKDSDSDDDEFWDRTGDVAKRKQRKANTTASVTLTYDELIKQETDLATELNKIEGDITKYQEKQKLLKEQEQARDSADLDSFMENLNEDVSQLDKTEIKKLRLEQQRIKNERQKLQRLIKLAKPYELPFTSSMASSQSSALSDDKSSTLRRQLPMIGKRNQFSKFKVAKIAQTLTASKETKALASDEEEVEDENDEVLEGEMKNKAGPQHAKTSSEPKKETVNQINKNLKSELKLKVDSIKETSKIQEIQAKPNVQHESKATDDDEVETLNETSADDLSSNTNTDSKSEDNDTNAKKRQRQRQRQRNKRQEVDVDELEKHESNEKYAKWLPPANQTGDGFTALNEKYGY